MDSNSTFIRDRTALDKAHELKEQANKAYGESDFTTAIRLYHQCLLHAKVVTQMTVSGLQEMARGERDTDENVFPSSSSSGTSPCESKDSAKSAQSTRSRMDSTTRGEEMKQEALELISKAYNNLAACIVNGPPRKKEDYLRAVFYCEKVLEIETENDKAVFRKGCAYKKAENYEKAIEAFQACPKVNTSATLIAECKAKITEDRKKRDAQIRANFAKARAAEQRNAEAAGMNGHAATNGNVH